MKVEHSSHITLTMAELTEIVKEHIGLCVQNKLTLTIEDYVAPTKSNSKEWIDVPKDWNKRHCPEPYSITDVVEVMYRNGNTDIDAAHRWTENWCQDGMAYDIIKYRLA